MSSLVSTIKHLKVEIYEDFSLPIENQMILKIGDPRGNNLHQVCNSNGDEFIASMPRKFRKRLWVKRGDFVVAEPIDEGNKVKAEIVRILYPDHIKHFVEEKVWPENFMNAISKHIKSKNSDFSSNIDLPDCDSDDEDFLVCNPNRMNIETYEESDDSSSEDDSDDESNSNKSENNLSITNPDSQTKPILENTVDEKK